jgi:hypothetical protein
MSLRRHRVEGFSQPPLPNKINLLRSSRRPKRTKLMRKERKRKRRWKRKKKRMIGSPPKVARSRNHNRSSKTASSHSSQPLYSSRTQHRNSRSM